MLYWKHRAFVEEYFKLNMNGTRAYKNVYGVESDEVAAVCASQLLRKTKVAQYISDRLDEKVMPANEVLARLSEQGRCEYANYLTPQGVDIKALLAAGKGHLIKKWTHDGAGRNEIEFYDGQTAQMWVGKHHKLFTEKYEVDATLNVDGLDVIMDHIYGKDHDQSG